MPAILLAAGFRPFFAFAQLYGALTIGLWAAAYWGALAVPGPLAPSLWHAHEAVYGYVAAVVAGFLLTAVPNWTGRPPLQGAPLAGLALLWLAGRAAWWFADRLPPPLVAALDLAFLPALIATAAASVIAARNWRNLPILVLIGLFWAGNVAVHWETVAGEAAAAHGMRGGVYALTLLIAVIGGRIVPAFTRGALAQRGAGAEVTSDPRVEVPALLALAAALILDLVGLTPNAGAWLALLAAMLLVRRMRGWQSARTGDDPLLWGLHVGHAWIPVGLALTFVARFFGLLPADAALHAFAIGAVGTMTLSVMARATLGHTGRPMRAGGALTAALLLVSLAALLRIVAGALGGETAAALIAASGAAWTVGFLAFAVQFLPLLTRPRADGRPG